MTSAREDILARVRAALRDVPAAEALEPAGYEPPPPPSGNAVARFAERVSDYRATVREADDVAATIAQVCAEFYPSSRQTVLSLGPSSSSPRASA